jgi:hypothetical protein
MNLVAEKEKNRRDKNSAYYVEDENYEIEQIKGFKNGLKKHEGTYLSIIIRNVSLLKNIKLRENDTFVIGYPKSGTTYIEEMCWLLKNGLDFERAKNELHILRVPYIDCGISHLELDEMQSPRVFKSHLLPKFYPENFHNKAKASTFFVEHTIQLT